MKVSFRHRNIEHTNTHTLKKRDTLIQIICVTRHIAIQASTRMPQRPRQTENVEQVPYTEVAWMAWFRIYIYRMVLL